MKYFRLLSKTRQVTEYSCGACALQAVLSYWGKDVDETELMKLIHTTPEEGTYPEDIVAAARSLGFDAEFKKNLTLDEVARFTAEGDPMVAVAQVWRSQKKLLPVETDWDNGHYIVVLGVDTNYVYFQDPYIRMSKAFISRQAFEEHWHQVMGGDLKRNPKLLHLGIFIRGTKRAAPKLGKHLTLSGIDFQAFGSLNLIITQFAGLLLPYEFLDELRDIWSRGDVRPDAFIFLAKDKNGTLRGIEGSQLREEADISAISALTAVIMARSLGSPELSLSAAEASIAAAEAGDFGLSAEDIHRIAERLPPDHSAIIVLCENVWERKFKEVAKRYKGAITTLF